MVCHRTGGRGRKRQGHHQQITHDQGRRTGNAGSGQGYVSPHLYAASRQLVVAIVLRPFSGKEFQKKFQEYWTSLHPERLWKAL